MAETGSTGAATATESRTEGTFKVSVLRSRKMGRVLFLEAGKDFVDTILSFLLLPVGTIIHMLASGAAGQEKNLGGISSIFKSVENLESSLLYVDKKSLLQPKPAVAGSSGSSISLLQGLGDANMQPPRSLEMPELPVRYYQCGDQKCSYDSLIPGGYCHCRQPFRGPTAVALPECLLSQTQAHITKQQVERASATREAGEGFVKENTTFLITDNLDVVPSTASRSIDMVSSLGVETLADLERNDIIVSTHQVQKLLHSALTSNCCLNDVFGKKMMSHIIR